MVQVVEVSLLVTIEKRISWLVEQENVTSASSTRTELMELLVIQECLHAKAKRDEPPVPWDR